MSPSINTIKRIWKKLTNKAYRDSYVAAHVSNTVASQILLLREARGWTQKELAEKAGMSQSRISALEDPNYENIEVGTLKRLASAFDVALTVRFIPFSELATWIAGLATEKLRVAEFASDAVPKSTTAVIADIEIFAAEGFRIAEMKWGGSLSSLPAAASLSGRVVPDRSNFVPPQESGSGSVFHSFAESDFVRGPRRQISFTQSPRSELTSDE